MTIGRHNLLKLDKFFGTESKQNLNAKVYKNVQYLNVFLYNINISNWYSQVDIFYTYIFFDSNMTILTVLLL